MTVPDWWEFFLLGLASWSTFQLAAHDDVLDKPRRKLLRLGNEWKEAGDPVPDEYRVEWGLFLTCPYCAGFWISVAWLVTWWIVPGVVLPLAALMALRAVVVAGHKTLGKEEDKTPSPSAELVAHALERIAKSRSRS